MAGGLSFPFPLSLVLLSLAPSPFSFMAPLSLHPVRGYGIAVVTQTEKMWLSLFVAALVCYGIWGGNMTVGLCALDLYDGRVVCPGIYTIFILQ